MRNASGSCLVASLRQVFGSQVASHGLRLLAKADSPGMEAVRQSSSPLLFRALASLNLHLLLVYLVLFVLAKLFARLHTRRTAGESGASWDHGFDDHHRAVATTGTEEEEEDIVDVGGAGQQQQVGMLFWFDEAVLQDTTTLLADEGKDHLMYTTPATARCLQVEGTAAFRAEESARIVSPCNHHDHRVDAEKQKRDEAEDVVAVDVGGPAVPDRRDVPVVRLPGNVSSVQAKIESIREEEEEEEEDARCDADDDRANNETEEEEEESFSEGQNHVKLFVNSRALADTRKLLLEGVVTGGGGGGGPKLVQGENEGGGPKLVQEEEEDKDTFRDRDSSRFGASTLTSESTSKSSVEWRSSTVTNKDSEAEYYPFSSSSRRSSARWESYALFRKYDEDMVYFHRVGAQKLTETESFRSIKYQPRSVSERIVHKLTPKPSAPIGLRDPYPDLERAYVAQVCLTWEALNWNYTSFRRHNGGDDGTIAARCCPARVAQEFQQFQVLLHRFVENEPYECGRRPEVYARMKNSTPKLLLVPEFREEEDEKDDLISAVQFLLILEDSIRTFMAFLRADKRSHYEMFREMVKRRSSSSGGAGGDHHHQSVVVALKKANKKKKSRLKDLTRPRRCLKRTRLREEEELSILLGLIDLKVVARVLRVPNLTDQQLHWCEEKMNRVRVDPAEGRMQRDASLLFFPAH